MSTGIIAASRLRNKEESLIITIDTSLGDGLQEYQTLIENNGYDLKVFKNGTEINNFTSLISHQTVSLAQSGILDLHFKNANLSLTLNNLGSKDSLKIIEVKDFGNIAYVLNSAFEGCSNLLQISSSKTPIINGDLVRTFSGCINLETINNIENWDVSSSRTFDRTFENARKFNQNINNWNVSNSLVFSRTFDNAKNFNQPLNNWNTSLATSMTAMFRNAVSFNQNINSWNVSNVRNFAVMFQQATLFNQPLNDWDTSSANNMFAMFLITNFNQPLNNWDVSNVVETRRMFRQNPVFNQPLNDWNTSNITNMIEMFDRASSFDQDISNWCVEQIASKPLNFDNQTPSTWLTTEKPNWGAPC